MKLRFLVKYVYRPSSANIDLKLCVSVSVCASLFRLSLVIEIEKEFKLDLY